MISFFAVIFFLEENKENVNRESRTEAAGRLFFLIAKSTTRTHTHTHTHTTNIRGKHFQASITSDLVQTLRQFPSLMK